MLASPSNHTLHSEASIAITAHPLKPTEILDPLRLITQYIHSNFNRIGKPAGRLLKQCAWCKKRRQRCVVELPEITKERTTMRAKEFGEKYPGRETGVIKREAKEREGKGKERKRKKGVVRKEKTERVELLDSVNAMNDAPGLDLTKRQLPRYQALGMGNQMMGDRALFPDPNRRIHYRPGNQPYLTTHYDIFEQAQQALAPAMAANHHRAHNTLRSH